tara:strand:+ start:872 stop:1264 length:393 start_codon:yes stop_codon:yes gene_type:complete
MSLGRHFIESSLVELTAFTSSIYISSLLDRVIGPYYANLVALAIDYSIDYIGQQYVFFETLRLHDQALQRFIMYKICVTILSQHLFHMLYIKLDQQSKQYQRNLIKLRFYINCFIFISFFPLRKYWVFVK